MTAALSNLSLSVHYRLPLSFFCPSLINLFLKILIGG